ncbi:MAG: hypothetical protein CPSOU_2004 [uncultured Paraburkholderia sp.]|nr:MAG: hypothetical protein CPSOU_2004 [uncultured Paraburkholderia sp.]
MGILDAPSLSKSVGDGRYAPLTVTRLHENAVAALGDSRTDMVSDAFISTAPTITQFAANGYINWARFLSGQRFHFDDTLNFGKSGDTIAQAAARVPNVIASGVSRCFVLIGTNDLAITPIANDDRPVDESDHHPASEGRYPADRHS